MILNVGKGHWSSHYWKQTRNLTIQKAYPLAGALKNRYITFLSRKRQIINIKQAFLYYRENYMKDFVLTHFPCLFFVFMNTIQMFKSSEEILIYTPVSSLTNFSILNFMMVLCLYGFSELFLRTPTQLIVRFIFIVYITKFTKKKFQSLLALKNNDFEK